MSAQAERLQRRLAAIPERVKEAVQPALLRSGEELAALMEQFAPQDTGALKESIVVTPAGQRTPPYSQPGGENVVPENSVMVTAGDHTVRYPHLVEFGTEEAAAQPFFWPAFRLARKRITSRIKRAVSKAVRQGMAA